MKGAGIVKEIVRIVANEVHKNTKIDWSHFLSRCLKVGGSEVKKDNIIVSCEVPSDGLYSSRRNTAKRTQQRDTKTLKYKSP